MDERKDVEKNGLMVFGNEEFGNVRVIIKSDEPWFIAKDVAKTLGYEKLDAMYRRIDSDDIQKIDPQSEEYQGFPQNGETLEPNKNVRILAIINESGLYQAIFGSVLPEAKKFKRWVTNEVLPSIRKHGTYMTTEVMEKTIADPDYIIGLISTIKKEKEKNKILKSENKKLKPMAELANQVCSSDGLLNFIQVANSFGECGRNTLMETLREEHVLLNSDSNWNMPSSQYAKHFKVVVRPRKTDEGIQEIATTLCKPSALKLIKKVLDKRKDLQHV